MVAGVAAETAETAIAVAEAGLAAERPDWVGFDG